VPRTSPSFRNERFGPAAQNPWFRAKIASFIGPSRVVGNIRDNHSLFRERSGPQEPLLGPIGHGVMAAVSAAGI